MWSIFTGMEVFTLGTSQPLSFHVWPFSDLTLAEAHTLEGVGLPTTSDRVLQWGQWVCGPMFRSAQDFPLYSDTSQWHNLNSSPSAGMKNTHVMDQVTSIHKTCFLCCVLFFFDKTVKNLQINLSMDFFFHACIVWMSAVCASRTETIHLLQGWSLVKKLAKTWAFDV